jgi:ferric-dicitrate binding protein FerR (iron transport regulator)
VRAGQIVITGPDGHATFSVSDGSTFEVFPNSQVTFRANPGTFRDLLDVWLGKIRVHIQRPGGQANPNRVFTPTAIISVRGTIFDISVDDDAEATVVLVEEGSVAVEHRLLPRSFDPKIVNAGQELTVHRSIPLDEARHIDIQRTIRVASDILMEVLLRTRGGGGIFGDGTSGPGLPGDKGAKPPPSAPPH